MQNLLILTLWCVLGAICAHFAKKRGRNPQGWFFIGLFLGLLGLGLLFILPKKKIETAITPPPAPIKNPFGSALWYYLDDEHARFGPMSLDGLKSAWTDKKIKPHSFVWNEAMENWKPLSEVLPAGFHEAGN